MVHLDVVVVCNQVVHRDIKAENVSGVCFDRLKAAVGPLIADASKVVEKVKRCF